MSFLSGVDDVAPDKAVLDVVAKFMMECGVSGPGAVDGLTEGDFEFAHVKELPVRAFARRAFRAALQAVEAKKSTATVGLAASASGGGVSEAFPPQPPHTSNAAYQDMLEVMGLDASALAVAHALSHGDKQVPVNEKLEAHKLSKLAFHLRPDGPVWQLLSSECEAAPLA